MADAFGVFKDEMRVRIMIGVAVPDQVDKSAVAAVLPYGKAEVIVEDGAMDIPHENGAGVTIVANAAAIVYLDLPEGRAHGDAP